MMQGRHDPAKDAASREQHRIRLALGEQIFEDGEPVIVPSIREIDGEERFEVIGPVGEKLFTGVFVPRAGEPRFMSVRRSNTDEARAYRASLRYGVRLIKAVAVSAKPTRRLSGIELHHPEGIKWSSYDPADEQGFGATSEALDRGQRARLIRRTRTGLGLSQGEFAGRFRIPAGTLRAWEQARAIAPDFAVASVRVIGQYPDIVTKAVA